MMWSIDSSDYYRLFMTSWLAIDAALGNRTKSEPQLVANLVWEIPRAINTLSSVGGWTIRSGGVFVHAQPFVECKSFPHNKPGSVEIGDLLLLRTEVRRGQASHRRALLLQAKKVSDLPATPDNANQHHLYATWPAFSYARSTKELNRKKRHITGLDLHDASRYLLIRNQAGRCFHQPRCWCTFHPCCCHVVTASPTQPKLCYYRCFLCELIDFLLGNAGKAYTFPPPVRTRNWDRVIEDMITVTTKRRSAFVRRAAKATADSRGQGRAFSFLSGDLSETYGNLHSLWAGEQRWPENGNDGPTSVDEEWPVENDESGGISIIEFIVSSEETPE
jgi:hypothetical protein